MNAEFIKYLKGWNEREATMATAEDMELWCTTQGLGIECDDVEIREDRVKCSQCNADYAAKWAGTTCIECDGTINEFPANTPVQEEGVVVLPAGSHSHSLKEVPAPGGQDSTRDRGEQPAEGVRLPSTALFPRGIDPEVKQTACDWLRVQGIFMDAGDL